MKCRTLRLLRRTHLGTRDCYPFFESLEARRLLSITPAEILSAYSQGTQQAGSFSLMQSIAEAAFDQVDLPLIEESIAEGLQLAEKFVAPFDLALESMPDLQSTIDTARQTLETAGFAVEYLSTTPESGTNDLLRLHYSRAWSEAVAFTFQSIAHSTGIEYFDDGTVGEFESASVNLTMAPVVVDVTFGVDLVDGTPTFFIAEGSGVSLPSLQGSASANGRFTIKSLLDVRVAGDFSLSLEGALSLTALESDAKLRAGDLGTGGTIDASLSGAASLAAQLNADIPLLPDLSWSGTWTADIGIGGVNIGAPSFDMPSVENITSAIQSGYQAVAPLIDLFGGAGGNFSEVLPAVSSGLSSLLGLSLPDLGSGFQLHVTPQNIERLIHGEVVDLISFKSSGSHDFSTSGSIPLAVMPFAIGPIPLTVQLDATYGAHGGYSYYAGLGVDTIGFYIEPNTGLRATAGAHAGLRGGLNLAGFLNVAGIEAGLGFNVGAQVGFSDPDPSDGRIYLDELASGILKDDLLSVMHARLYGEAFGYARAEINLPWPLPDITLFDEHFTIAEFALGVSDQNREITLTQTRRTKFPLTQASLPDDMLSGGLLTIDASSGSTAGLNNTVFVKNKDGGIEVTWRGRGTRTFHGVSQIAYTGNNLSDRLVIADGVIVELFATGDAGNDYFDAGEGAATIHGGDGDDIIKGSSSDDVLEGGNGNDLIEGRDGNDQIAGGDGSDDLYGDSGDDVLAGEADADRLEGGDGADNLDGGAGADWLDGNAGEDTLLGRVGDDVLLGGRDRDLLYGEDGDDLIIGDHGDDVLEGGLGDDSLVGDDGDDSLAGQQGDDVLFGGTGNDILLGGDSAGDSGSDYLHGGSGNDSLYGGEGDDHLSGAEGEDMLFGGRGADQLNGGPGLDNLYGEAGDDILQLDFQGGIESAVDLLDGGVDQDRLEILGTTAYLDADGPLGLPPILTDDFDDWIEVAQVGSGLFRAFQRDNLSGAISAQFDFYLDPTLDGNVETLGISGLGGDDRLTALPGFGRNLIMDGGTGDDILTGGDGRDILLGGDGNDGLTGGGSNDVLRGGEGDDSLDAGIGDDVLYGDGGHDTLLNGPGRDVAYGGEGNDAIEAGSGIYGDLFYGGPGNDTLVGGDGIDVISGEVGDDRLEGGELGDFLIGGDGDDTILGGAGRDAMLGGAGQDTIYAYLETPANEPQNPTNWVDMYQEMLARENEIIGLPGQTGLIFQVLTQRAAIILQIEALEQIDPEDRTPEEEVQLTRLQVDAAQLLEDRRLLQNEVAVLNNRQNDLLPDQEVDIDLLDGGDGNDFLWGSLYADAIHGGSGDDVINHSAGVDNISGGDGQNDVYRLGGTAAADDIVIGGTWDSFDNLSATVKVNTVPAGHLVQRDIETISVDALAGDDKVMVQFGNQAINKVEILGGDGDDILDASTSQAMVTLYGGNDNDLMMGGKSDDWLEGEAGDDEIVGGDGNDRIFGGDGHDSLTDDYGEDTIRGGAGNDRIDGGEDGDLLYGDEGNDEIYGGRGGNGDQIFGGTGNDALDGGGGGDILNGEEGRDSLYGGEGHDELHGGDGADVLFGEAGNDFLDGGEGDDAADGGDGSDTLRDLRGRNNLHGGAGDDNIFVSDDAGTYQGWGGNDTLSFVVLPSDTSRLVLYRTALVSGSRTLHLSDVGGFERYNIDDNGLSPLPLYRGADLAVGTYGLWGQPIDRNLVAQSPARWGIDFERDFRYPDQQPESAGWHYLWANSRSINNAYLYMEPVGGGGYAAPGLANPSIRAPFIHPGYDALAVIGYRFSQAMTVDIDGVIQDIDGNGGDGVGWTLTDREGGVRYLRQGAVDAAQVYQPSGTNTFSISGHFRPAGEWLHFIVDPGAAQDGNDSTYVKWTMYVAADINAPANLAPAIAPVKDFDVTEGELITTRIHAYDPDNNDAIRFRLNGAPEDAVIDPISGDFSWTARDGSDQPVAITASAYSAANPSLSREYTFFVRVSNTAPTLSVDGPVQAGLSDLVTLQLISTDVSPVDSASTFTYWIDWNGDGSDVQVISGPAQTNVSHTYISPGTRTVRLTATDKDGGISDMATHTIDVVRQPMTVVGRHIFYNNSKFDDNTVGVSTSDDAAIAPDRSPYFAGGGIAPLSSITNYSQGINGIMVDIANAAATLTLSDFTFKVGSSNSLGSWISAPAPQTFAVRPGAGAGGSDRVEIIWADGVIKNTWLQVIVEGNDEAGGMNTNTGLAASDVFFFGNKVGDTQISSPTAVVTTSAGDELAARNNLGVNVGITNVYDFDKNNIVSAGDQLIARNNVGFLMRISIATPTAGPNAVLAAGPLVVSQAFDDAVVSALATPRTAGAERARTSMGTRLQTYELKVAAIANGFSQVPHAGQARVKAGKLIERIGESTEIEDAFIDMLLERLGLDYEALTQLNPFAGRI